MPEEDELIENCALHVTQWIDSEGQMRYTVKTRGDVPLSTQIGLLELAKLTLMKDGGV